MARYLKTFGEEARADLPTEEISADAHDELGCAGIRFPSRLDGLPCYALFEGRARLEAIDPPIPLTDPPPPALEHVAADWGLLLQPAPAPAPAVKKAP